MRIKPCTLGKRHKWTWQHNAQRITVRGSSVELASVGRYRCACGARKIGDSFFPEIPSPAPAGDSTNIGETAP